MAEYPDNCVQNLIGGKWWEPEPPGELSRGSVVYSYIQFFSEVPYELVPTRLDPQRHDTAVFTAKPLHAGGRRAAHADLPVAALPRLAGADCYLVNRAKRRPCLVLGGVHRKEIESRLTSGMIKSATHEFLMVAPYFSVGQEGRSGYNPAFVERIMHAQYSRFFWEHLPGERGQESILRFDLMQPVGFHHQAYSPFGYRLSSEALRIIDEWLEWVMYDRDGATVQSFRELMRGFGAN